KQKIIQDYGQELAAEGELERGEALYRENCSVCHQIGGEYGTAYGPDLASIRNRRPEAILTDILDPNLSIADGYDLWEITMKNGETKQGIIGSETAGSITLRVYGGENEVMARQDIQSLKSLGMSIMPNGLENLLSPEDMRDLLTFIKKLKWSIHENVHLFSVFAPGAVGRTGMGTNKSVSSRRRQKRYHA